MEDEKCSQRSSAKVTRTAGGFENDIGDEGKSTIPELITAAQLIVENSTNSDDGHTKKDTM